MIIAVALALATLVMLPGAAEAGKSTADGASTANGAASTTTSTTRPAPHTASMAPNVNLANDQVVTVSWSGFHPTTGNLPYGPFHTVGILECKANPVHAIGDCYMNSPFAGSSGDANAVGIGLSAPTTVRWWGTTASDGTGFHNFKVLAGTLLNNNFGNVYSFDCTPTSNCVIKVVDTLNGAYSDAELKRGPSIPLNFGPLPNCSPSVSQQVNLEGAASSSYAFQGWGAQLCQGANPLNVSFTGVPEAQARRDFLSGATDVAVAALAPTAAEKQAAPGARTYLPAPVDVGGVSVDFNIRDAVTLLPVTTLHLTPRLVAMLLTNSATSNSLSGPGSYQHVDVHGKTFLQNLTSDSEFTALNPGVTWPSDTVEPIIRAERNDDAFILTQWIAADYDAQQFLAGKDICGSKLNAPWAGPAAGGTSAITYPTDIFVAADNAYPTYYFPVQGVPETVRHLLFQLPVGSLSGINPPQSRPGIATSQGALTGVYDTVTANRSGFQSAGLRAASATSHLTVQKGICVPTSTAGFVAPTNDALNQGYQQMTVNPDGTRSPPVSTAVATAYPLAKVDYGFVPTSGTPLNTANSIAAVLRYAAGVGQTPGLLPFGYPPLPDDLALQTAAAANIVVKNAVLPPAPTTTATTTAATTTTTSTTSTTRPATSAAGTTQQATTSGTTPSPSPATTAVARTSSAPPVTTPPVATTVTSQPAQPPRKFFLAAGSLTGDRWLFPLFVLLSGVFAASGTILRWVGRRTGRKAAKPS